MNTFQNLPFDIVWKIFDYLDSTDILICGSTCHIGLIVAIKLFETKFYRHYVMDVDDNYHFKLESFRDRDRKTRTKIFFHLMFINVHFIPTVLKWWITNIDNLVMEYQDAQALDYIIKYFKLKRGDDCQCRFFHSAGNFQINQQKDSVEAITFFIYLKHRGVFICIPPDDRVWPLDDVVVCSCTLEYPKDCLWDTN